MSAQIKDLAQKLKHQPDYVIEWIVKNLIDAHQSLSEVKHDNWARPSGRAQGTLEAIISHLKNAGGAE